MSAKKKPQGITKDFFTKPLRVPCTFQTLDGKQFPVVFTIRRDTAAEATGQAVALSLFNAGDNYEWFCSHLESAPEGLDDFPLDNGTSLQDRARRYFSEPHWRELIAFIRMEVERAQKPVEFFQRF